MMNQPTMHKPIKMGTRVRFKAGSVSTDLYNRMTGEVQGVASMNVIFIYIVSVDVPFDIPELGLCKCIAVPGTSLEGEDGTSFEI
jgi:hypothetical protein